MYLLWLYLFSFIVFNLCVCIKLNKIPVGSDPDGHAINSRNNYLKGYAGLGFDLIVGNPFNNFNDLNTFGLRSSIIAQPVVRIDEFDNIFVEGNKRVWYRSVVNCYQDFEPHLIDNESDLVKDLFNDFSLDSPFSEELWQRNARGLDVKNFVNSDSKLKILKSYCSLYETGLILPYNGSLSKDFREGVKKLPDSVERASDCPLDLFITEPKTDKCKNIRAWINFFKVYGTHVTTYVLIGGKFINMDSAVNIKLNEKVDKSTSENATQTTDIFQRKVKASKLKKNMWIIGGYFVEGLERINSASFATWVRTIRNRAMPIKAKFSALSIFFPEKQQAYLSSLKYYSELMGIDRPT
ncbi:uncharacterized protein TOT_030000068 [Theileria orientalis strain Shintoku]|uniref:MACPF domain-containing protein n=1 Tax=Theileria orientalis strain Shintoku TaxID=869250 RepID=J4C3P6_THEOR|nr:uncharacterized protein TOT_030000068 [Theileria orientalis strain Shintoku]BAM40806.1 uncharacterized protein TOT_030000068 [Theileria orientalis strain Shintoku]|eukprot:XP_009691107.1 uncharacterized protein TOT_030000068 [Theileria orientalis strain Shintoku]